MDTNEFLNSPKVVIVALSILSIALLIMLGLNSNKNKFYYGEIVEQDIVVSDLHFYSSKKINYFFANNASYVGEDANIKEFYIAYYVEVNGEKKLIEDVGRSDLKDTKLSDMITVYSKFKVAEFSNKSEVFTKDVVKNIENLHILVEATKENDERITIDYKVNVNKVEG